MPELSTARDVIALWPSRSALACDLCAEPGGAVTLGRIHKWAQSGAIPAPYHARIIRAAERRGYALTAADLVRVHDAGRDAA